MKGKTFVLIFGSARLCTERPESLIEENFLTGATLDRDSMTRKVIWHLPHHYISSIPRPRDGLGSRPRRARRSDQSILRQRLISCGWPNYETRFSLEFFVPSGIFGEGVKLSAIDGDL
jgi:hypothetical protein